MRNYLFLAVGLLMGVIVGFMFANMYNRGVQARVTSPSATAPSAASSGGDADLTLEEIREKLAQADAAPQNVAFQRNLGLALLTLFENKKRTNEHQAPETIEAVLRVLERALTANPKDREVLVALGNGYWDVAYAKEDNGSFLKARDFYSRALEIEAQDPGVLVDLGITYAKFKPPDLTKAIEYYEKALKVDPSHQRTLEWMVDAQIALAQKAKAFEYLEILRKANPSNPRLVEFESKLGAAK